MYNPRSQLVLKEVLPQLVRQVNESFNKHQSLVLAKISEGEDPLDDIEQWVEDSRGVFDHWIIEYGKYASYKPTRHRPISLYGDPISA